ncbi:MAG: 4-methyl-5(b-hydroxyethyl)-thiazole monophosphate biosynthesis [Candidatus Omnitrophota bacterium]|jgi:4-methyl-5(b-hydroxyethyl)-thiazole monophosphate biosynthesis
MSKSAIIVLAEGFEEIEAITPIDVLRRAEIEVSIAYLDCQTVTGAHGVVVQADIDLDTALNSSPDCLILPGGLPGAENLSNSTTLKALIQKMHKQQKIIAAICAAPALVLAETGILKDKAVTCYPGFEQYFEDNTAYKETNVITDGNIITSRGPGTALEFSLAIVQGLIGREAADSLRKDLLLT